MKDHLLSLAAAEPESRARLNLVREYLQAHILRSAQEAGAFASLAFQGGTALRFIHGLRRFSEDLDFSLERPGQDRGLEHLAKAVKRDFELAGYEVEATVRTARTVHAAEVRFPGLLHDAGGEDPVHLLPGSSQIEAGLPGPDSEPEFLPQAVRQSRVAGG